MIILRDILLITFLLSTLALGILMIYKYLRPR